MPHQVRRWKKTKEIIYPVNNNTGKKVTEVEIRKIQQEANNHVREVRERNFNTALRGDFGISYVTDAKQERAYNTDNNRFFCDANIIFACPTNKYTTEDQFFQGRLHPSCEKHKSEKESILASINGSGVNIVDDHERSQYKSQKENA